jgi:thiaminase (transcriptional activator TenA)
MPFSAEAWSRNLRLYEETRDMPFNRELAAGTLPIAVFQHYIVQDAHYLVALAQALAVAAAKADAAEQIVQFSHAAAGAIEVERSLHADYFTAFGLSAADVAATSPSPICHHYTSFLLATAFREPLPVLLAAMLPCFWVYREVGRHLLSRAAASNCYQAWLDTYGGDDFAAAVDRMIAVTDAAAADASPSAQAAMHRAYARAAQLEWMFWDSATRLDTWPV